MSNRRNSNPVKTATHSSPELRGNCGRIVTTREPEVCLEGPAGTGKSVAILWKIHRAAQKYPGMRALIVRQTRESLTQSALVTYETQTLSKQWFARIARNCPAYEDLSSRLRNGVMPYQQMLSDTNPDAPTHWIKRRALDGKLELWTTRHEDNPRYYQGDAWTLDGEEYMARLERLTGVRFLRLRKGIWAGAEGQIYDLWDEAVHLVDSFDVPRDWSRYRAIDFGYANPLVCQWWTSDPDGRLLLYRELYGAGRIVSDWAADILRHSEGERIEFTVADHDAEDRATLANSGIMTIPANKAVVPGIEAVQLRLRKAGDGKPRLFIMKGCTVSRDPKLIESKKPASTAEEIGAYIWAPPLPNRAPKEEPAKINDHGCDAMRYLVAEVDGLGTYSAGAW
jgi:phage terminase large subunit